MNGGGVFCAVPIWRHPYQSVHSTKHFTLHNFFSNIFLLRNCIFLVRIQADKTGLKAFHWSDTADDFI